MGLVVGDEEDPGGSHKFDTMVRIASMILLAMIIHLATSGSSKGISFLFYVVATLSLITCILLWGFFHNQREYESIIKFISGVCGHNPD